MDRATGLAFLLLKSSTLRRQASIRVNQFPTDRRLRTGKKEQPTQWWHVMRNAADILFLDIFQLLYAVSFVALRLMRYNPKAAQVSSPILLNRSVLTRISLKKLVR